MLPPTVEWSTCTAGEPMAWISLRELMQAVATTPALLLPLVAVVALLLVGLAGFAWPWRALLSALLVVLVSLIYTPFGTTVEAARLLGQARVNCIYVSGDGPATAQQLLSLGVPAERIDGDSCARTTWENATITTAWIRQHLPVTPIAAEPNLSPHDRNRLALRARWMKERNRQFDVVTTCHHRDDGVNRARGSLVCRWLAALVAGGLARFEREHLAGSSPRASSGDSSPSALPS